jgi:Tol biopolymer transport system component
MKKPMLPFGASLILLTAILGVPTSASAATGNTTRVSVASDGSQANSASFDPVISGDGRYIVFESSAGNLVPGDTNGVGDVFVHDRDTGGTERVSVAGDGAQANGSSGFEQRRPAISADGRYIAFESFATNLVPDDTNDAADMFVHDRVTGSTERVSVASDGSQASFRSAGLEFGSFTPSISGDGRFVAFFSRAVNLVPDDTNDGDVFVHDRVTGSTERVSVASDGTQTDIHNESYTPAISGDGRYVAFSSRANNLVPGDTNGTFDTFVHDRVTGSTERVSVTGDGTQANGNTFNPSISGDGRHVAFDSDASNLVPGDTNSLPDVYLHDRDSGSVERVSVASDGAEGNNPSAHAVVTPDGRYVAFGSFANNLVPGDTSFYDMFVRDRVTGSTERVSVTSDGTQANEHSLGVDNSPAVPAISGDGRYVAFTSRASNLVPADTNGVSDVFVRDRQGVAPSDTMPPTLTLPDTITAEATGPAGATVTYTATASDTVDPNPAVSCTPTSGSTFPIGTTTVDCTSTDGSGNQATGSFTVTVVGAAGQLEGLQTLILAYPLKGTEEASLLKKVTGAQDAAAAGKIAAACSKLADFLGQVTDFRTAGKLTAAQATELTAYANQIRAVLSC